MVLCTRFDPQPKGLSLFSDAERERAYVNARPFLLQQMRFLLKDDWKRSYCNSEQFLFYLYKGLESEKEKLRVVLPVSFSHFLDLSKTNTWRSVFENPVIFKARKKGNKNTPDLYIAFSPPLSNIFYLLQVLAPGMLVIHHDYRLPDADVKLSRLLPRATWIRENIETMSMTDALLAAANDRNIAFHEVRTARRQNNSSSQRSSMPGTNAGPGPATAKNQKNAPQKKKKAQKPQNNNPHHTSGSLPGTDAPPAPAKNQKQKRKSAPQKKRNARMRNNSTYSITPGYLVPMDPTDIDQGYDWGVCDKDCGWCGRCVLNF